jgi:Ca2+-binding RTX toxin-like protein
MLAAVGGTVAAVIAVLLVLALAGGRGSTGATETPSDDGLLHLGDRTLAAEAPPMTGNDVIELQRTLTRFGYYAGPLNGEFDGATANAVTGFKACWDLTNNTAVDAATVVDLKKEPTKLGTNQPDHLVGTQADDIIYGMGGDDTLDGLGGNDVLCGDAGNDTVIGRDGDDHLGGGGGNDQLFGKRGPTCCTAGSGRTTWRAAPVPTSSWTRTWPARSTRRTGGDGDDACRVLPDDVETNCERS